MSKTAKWVIAATILLVTGLMISGASFAYLGFDANALSNVEYVTNTYEVEEDFESINIKADRDDVTFVDSEDGKCKVVCLEEKDRLHNVGVENDTLVIDEQKGKNHFMFGLLLKKPEITVYINKREFKGGITVETDTGDVEISDISSKEMNFRSDTGNIVLSKTDTKDLKISTDTGNIPLSEVSCESLYAESDTGNILLSDVLVSGKMEMDTATGNIQFDGCDAETISAKTDTGNVKGTLLTGKKFEAKSSTGKVSVPESTSGGKCEIKTATGNVKIEIKQ